MGSGASKQSTRSTVVNVTSTRQTTVLDNRTTHRVGPPTPLSQRQQARATRGGGGGARPSDRTDDVPSTSTALVHVIATPSTSSSGRKDSSVVSSSTAPETPPMRARVKPGELAAAANGEITDSSLLSGTFSTPSSKSVTEELDNLTSELDQVLIGHYYAVTKPAAGVLRTAEIAVLERHNQLEPLPVNYQHCFGGTSGEGPGPSEWVRPEDLVQRERELRTKMEEETEQFPRRSESVKCVKKKKKKKMAATAASPVSTESETQEHKLQLTITDLEEDQDGGDFDIEKFKAVNTSKGEHAAGPGAMDIYSRATYKRYSAGRGAVDRNKLNDKHKTVERVSPVAVLGSSPRYAPSEEELLESIERDFEA